MIQLVVLRQGKLVHYAENHKRTVCGRPLRFYVVTNEKSFLQRCPTCLKRLEKKRKTTGVSR